MLALTITLTPILCHWASVSDSSFITNAARALLVVSILLWTAASYGGINLGVGLAGMSLAILNLVYLIASFPEFGIAAGLQAFQAPFAVVILAHYIGQVR